MTRTRFALAVVATLATPAYAQVVEQGAGATPCSTITGLYQRPENKLLVDTMVSSWASGFMSSANLARLAQGSSSRDLGAASVAAQTLTLRRWCKAHPNDKLLTAVMTLFAGLPANNDADVASQDQPR